MWKTGAIKLLKSPVKFFYKKPEGIAFKRVLITAALIYANGEPHLGHMKSTYLPADILARYYKAKGVETLYVCATDEHGTPIQVEAEKAGMDPENFVLKYHELDKKLFRALDIEFDVFHRTHSPENEELTHMFLKALRENGYIYKKTVKQYYCENCKRYLPDRYVRGECPVCGAKDQYSDYCDSCGKTFEPGDLKNPRCTICGSMPVLKESEHFIFKLSAFADFLKEWIQNNEEFQPQVTNYVLNWIEEGLKDWDITREEDYWGFDMPFDDAITESGKRKKVYVWFDAPIGYIAATVKWCKDHNDNWERWWKDPETKIIHHIGKDIVYHHYLFWPAMLYGTKMNFNLPSAIPTRGFLTLHKKKFSKSRGIYIGVEEFLESFPADYARFYLTLITPYSIEDTDWNWEEFRDKINSELVDNLGNFIHRVLMLIYRYFDGKVPEPGEFNNLDKELLEKIKSSPQEIGSLMERYELKAALEKILDLARDGNRYLNAKEPWKLIKKDKRSAGTVLFVAVHLVKCLGILLWPFIPRSATRILELLNIERGKWDDAGKIDIKPGHVIREPVPLFKKVSDEQIRDKIMKISH